MASVTQITNNSGYYTFYDGISFVDRATEDSTRPSGASYNYNGISKLWTVT